MCSNYRAISLIGGTAKLYEKILENILKESINAQLEDLKSRSRKGNFTQDHIFTIREITERIIEEILKRKNVSLKYANEMALDRIK